MRAARLGCGQIGVNIGGAIAAFGQNRQNLALLYLAEIEHRSVELHQLGIVADDRVSRFGRLGGLRPGSAPGKCYGGVADELTTYYTYRS